MVNKRLISYVRTRPCPYMNTARYVLGEHNVDYKEILIDKDSLARERVIEWTGFESVPTIIVAEDDSLLPIEIPESLPKGASPRGIDRGYMITEPSGEQLEQWLAKHGFIEG